MLNTPSHHRVHHGSNRKYIDRNHGSILIIWDRLFGTFQREEEPVVYGLTKNINTYNPGRIASHEYRDIVRDVADSTTWRDRLSFVLRGSGLGLRPPRRARPSPLPARPRRGAPPRHRPPMPVPHRHRGSAGLRCCPAGTRPASTIPRWLWVWPAWPSIAAPRWHAHRGDLGRRDPALLDPLQPAVLTERRGRHADLAIGAHRAVLEVEALAPRRLAKRPQHGDRPRPEQSRAGRRGRTRPAA